MKARISILMAFVGLLTGCYYDNEEELYNCSADANTVKFSTTINSLLTSYGCISCHGSTAPSGGVNLSTHTGVKTVADNGRLYGAINHATGFVPMPQGGGKMAGCDIQKIKVWIDAGAPNN